MNGSNSDPTTLSRNSGTPSPKPATPPDTIEPDSEQQQVYSGMINSIESVRSQVSDDVVAAKQLDQLETELDSAMSRLQANYVDDKTELEAMKREADSIRGKAAGIKKKADERKENGISTNEPTLEGRLAEMKGLVEKGGLPPEVGQTLEEYEKQFAELKKKYEAQPDKTKEQQESDVLREDFEDDLSDIISKTRSTTPNPEIVFPGLPALNARVPDEYHKDFVLGEGNAPMGISETEKKYHGGKTKKHVGWTLGIAGRNKTKDFFDDEGNRKFKEINENKFQARKKNGAPTHEVVADMVNILYERGKREIDVDSNNPVFRREAWIAAKIQEALNDEDVKVTGLRTKFGSALNLRSKPDVEPRPEWESMLVARLEKLEKEGKTIKRWPEGANKADNSLTFDTKPHGPTQTQPPASQQPGTPPASSSTPTKPLTIELPTQPTQSQSGGLPTPTTPSSQQPPNVLPPGRAGDLTIDIPPGSQEGLMDSPPPRYSKLTNPAETLISPPLTPLADHDESLTPKRVHNYALEPRARNGIPSFEITNKENAPPEIVALVEKANANVASQLQNGPSDAFLRSKIKRDFYENTRQAFNDEKSMQQLRDRPVEELLEGATIASPSDRTYAKVYKVADDVAIVRHLGRQREPKFSVATGELGRSLNHGQEIKREKTIGEQVGIGATAGQERTRESGQSRGGRGGVK